MNALLYRSLLLFVLFAHGWCFAQRSYPTHQEEEGSLRFQHLTTDDGLSDNAITCVYQDRGGLIWIGSENGLNKFDGSTVQVVPGTGMAIASVIEDRAGIIWIATKDHGLIRFDRTSGDQRSFTKTDALPRSMASEKLTALYDLNDTTLLIGSREVTLMFLDKRTFNFTYWVDSTSISPSRASALPLNSQGWCHALVPLDEKKLWIGFLNSYISVVADRSTGSITQYALNNRTGFETATSAALCNGDLCMGGWQNGLDVVPLGDLPNTFTNMPNSARVIDTDEEVTALVPWKNGELMVGIRQHGLFRLAVKSGNRARMSHDRSDPSSLCNDRVRCLLKDRNGTLWVGTANGLDYHVPDNWSFTAHDLFGTAKGNEQDVVFHRVEGIGVEGVRIFSSDGFFVQDSIGSPLRHQPFDHAGRKLQPTVLAADHHGDPLIGTEYGIARGFGTPDHPRRGLEPISPFGPKSTLGSMYQVRGIAADTIDGRPVFVIATLGFGVQVVDAITERIIGIVMPNETDRLNTHSLVNSMTKSRSGKYWFGSAGGSFSWSRQDPLVGPDAIDTGAVIRSEILALGEDVRQVHMLRDTVWAITRSGILLRVVDDRSTNYVPPLWLRGAMFGFAVDQRGRFWITTDNGLLRFDPMHSSFIRVPVNDGQRFKKLTGAISALADGRIALCADNSLITFRPEAFDLLPELPVAFLTGTWAAGKPLTISGATVEISYRSSVIEVGVSAAGFGFPEPLLLEYRLDGVEEEWRTTSLRENIRYAGVPAGSHRLLVKVRDAYGRVGPEHVLLDISVSAPFWLKWWFYAIIAALVSLAVYAWSRYRLLQTLKLQTVRNRIASDLHDEVGSSLSSITIGSQLAAQLSGTGNEKVLEIMARIGETSSESLRSMSDIVWAIDPKNDQGEALVKRMRRIATELLESKGIDVSFSVSADVEELKLPMNARKEIVLIYKEAVHNVSKYSNASLVQVSLHRLNGKLTMSVKDDGKGFDPALHPDGHGLGSMKRRATSLGSVLTLMSAPGLGTLVGVEVDITRIRD